MQNQYENNNGEYWRLTIGIYSKLKHERFLGKNYVI